LEIYKIRLESIIYLAAITCFLDSRKSHYKIQNYELLGENKKMQDEKWQQIISESNRTGKITKKQTSFVWGEVNAVIDEVKDLYVHIKARDHREPGRKAKAQTEREIADILRRVFKRQANLIRAHLEMQFPTRTKTFVDPPLFLLDWADGDYSDMVKIFIWAIKKGITLFGAGQPIIDYTLTNAEAAKWARDYVYNLVRDINETTQKALQKAIGLFVETPGMILRDIMNLLPFDEARAAKIAITETTRVYAQGNQMAGEALKREYPDLRVIKTWFTNNDDRVCEICGPLEGKVVDIDSDFADNVNNPPAHVNCRCWTQARTKI
jgi:SPP1 gp7 family putative phage head morphogenesis protein